MKKLTLIVAALALVMGFSQCKKDNLTPNDNRIQITLNANYGGDRTSFTPGTSSTQGSFGWSDGVTEYINVSGNNSGYLGYLTNEDNKGTGTFTGSIETPNGDETLYFFYLGNGSHAGANTLDFSNQVGDLDHVTNCHVAIGRVAYSGQTAFENVTLEMKMAIARFNLSGFGSENVYLNGENVYSTASINYNNGTISGNSKGYINVGTAGADKYVALIPSVTTETEINFNSSTKTSTKTFPNGIQAGKFYANGDDALSVTAAVGSGIPGTFSVSATKKVFFSKGNLQYNPHGSSTDASGNVIGGTWRFAEHQYDAVGNNAGNNVFDGTRSEQDAWIDLFGWGTSGWAGASANTVSNYQPWAYLGNNPSTSSYGYGYGPNTKEGYSYTYTYSLTGTYANCDWGVYNTISNGGSGWRTLTGGNTDDSEWKYLIETRSASTVAGTENARFFKTKVNNINGLVILPDVYVHPTGVTNPTNINVATNIGWSSITLNYTLDEWAKIEAAGAIFLPCTGYRSYSSNNPGYTSDYGCYWSSTVFSASNACYFLSAGTVKTDQNNAKRLGYFVRLVKDVE